MANQVTHGFEIKIQNLYKIFGPKADQYIRLVEQGMSKEELNSKHRHVLGLKNINISMPAGGIQVIMGLSGSGKSTLLRHINRLIDPSAGQILVDGKDIMTLDKRALQEYRRHSTAMVFQNFALLPHRTVLENTVYGLELQGRPHKEQMETAMRWIERVGLKGFENHYPNQLSGGMQQRVGLARALTNDAPILLMDEAYSALDPLIRMDMQTVLLEIQKEVMKTVVFITHDLDEALRLGDRIAILRDGEVVQQGAAQDIILNPADQYIERFVREVDRSRVVRVDRLAYETLANRARPQVCVSRNTTLDEATRALIDAGQSELGILDGDSKCLGVLSLDTMLAVTFGTAK